MSWYSEQHYGKVVSDTFDEIYYMMFFRKGMKLLDIGCGVGNFLVQDRKNCMGIDRDKDQLTICRKRGLKAFQYDIEKGLPFRKNQFDAVNCRHIIEHVAEPSFLMKEVWRVLKPSGKLVMLTPDMKVVKEHFWDEHTHKRPFTKDSLYRTAYDAGFRTLEVYSFPEGLFGMRKLYGWGLNPKMIKRIEKIYGRLVREDTIILEAFK
jgi:ubiquinone/menaquinone biosynthesis C-methylase UbiE